MSDVSIQVLPLFADMPLANRHAEQASYLTVPLVVLEVPKQPNLPGPRQGLIKTIDIDPAKVEFIGNLQPIRLPLNRDDSPFLDVIIGNVGLSGESKPIVAVISSRSEGYDLIREMTNAGVELNSTYGAYINPKQVRGFRELPEAANGKREVIRSYVRFDRAAYLLPENPASEEEFMSEMRPNRLQARNGARTPANC